MKKICGVLILATVVLSTVSITESTQTKLPNNLQDLVRKNGKQSEVSSVEDALRAKVDKLMPLLDDYKGNTKGNNDYDIHSNSDNIRNGKFNPVNNKYKKLRNEIEKLLEIESVSKKTRKAVMNTLDEITTDLMTNECLWKKKIIEDKNLTTTEQTELIMKHIQQKWNKISNQYSIKYTGHNDKARKTFAMLSVLRNFVFDVHEEYKMLENRYAVQCDIVKKLNNQEDTKQMQANGQDGECNVQICSAEISHFMMDFYKQVKEAFLDVFNTYIEMYQKDVKQDERRRGYSWEDSFENNINQAEAYVEKKMVNTFLQGVEPLEFTSNYTLSMMDALKQFIDKTIDNALTLIDKSVSRKLKTSPQKLRLTVREDLKTSADIELGNLKQEFKNKICTVFQTCNGVATWRKNNNINEDYVDPNSIQLKLKLGFDKGPLKDIFNLLSRKINTVFKAHEFEDHNKDHARKDFGYEVNQTRPLNASEFNPLNVTRTTLKEYLEQGTTKFTETLSLVNVDASVSMKGNKSLPL